MTKVSRGLNFIVGSGSENTSLPGAVMGKGYSVVVGMTIAYAVSFFGLLLAYIVYQRNHHKDDLWRRRPVGVSFFAAVYGYIFPLLLVANAFLTLMIKIFKGWDFNRFIWTNQALGWPIVAGVVLFWLVGRLFWRMKSSGYAAAVIVTAAASVVMLLLVISGISQGRTDLHSLGSYATGLLWHILWTAYFLRAGVRGLFFTRESAA